MWRVGKALLPHDEYVASLPRKRMAVAALIRDADDRALLVSPTYENSWLVPGGVVDAGESPHAACRREVAEETGLILPPGRILAVDWTPQDPDWPEGVFFVYDGGTLSEADIASIAVRDGELDGFRFVAADEIASLVNPPLARRIESAFQALRSGSVLSLENGKPIELAPGRRDRRPSACPAGHVPNTRSYSRVYSSCSLRKAAISAWCLCPIWSCSHLSQSPAMRA
jgi:ADP-ribose pyrophosphatase YjhB (NUDIX family)